MNDMKRTSDCCPSCCVKPPSPCTADCSLQRTPVRKREAPAPAAQPPSIGYVNLKEGTFRTLAQLAATERNGDLIASGEIVEVCPVVRGAAPASPASAPEASERKPTDLSHRLRETADQQPGWKPLLTAAADEIERYYGGMMNWKKTAEAKDAALAAPVAPEQASVREALRVGAAMANVLFNLAQQPGSMLSSDNTALFDKLRKEWDAARAMISKGA